MTVQKIDVCFQHEPSTADLAHGLKPECDEQEMTVELEWEKYLPASHWEPAEGGFFTVLDSPEICPGCGHEYTERERKQMEEQAIDSAQHAQPDSRYDER